MRSLITSLSIMGLVFLLLAGNMIRILNYFPIWKFVFFLGIGMWIFLTGLNGYLELKLKPWNGLNVKQVVQRYGWAAFFRGEE